MTIKRSTLIEGILIICMVAVLGLVTAIREPVVEKNQVKTLCLKIEKNKNLIYL